MRLGRHNLRSKYRQGTHVRIWLREALKDVGVNGAIYIGPVRICAWLCWRNAIGSTTAWCAFVEVLGLYIGHHRINGKTHDWVF